MSKARIGSLEVTCWQYFPINSTTIWLEYTSFLTNCRTSTIESSSIQREKINLHSQVFSKNQNQNKIIRVEFWLIRNDQNIYEIDVHASSRFKTHKAFYHEYSICILIPTILINRYKWMCTRRNQSVLSDMHQHHWQLQMFLF